MSRGSKGAASARESLYQAKRGLVRAQTSPPSPRPSRSTARPLYPTIHLSAHSIDHGGCKWSSLPFTRASGTPRERITDFHRATLHRGACGRGRARPGSFMLERMIEISCNVIIAHSPFRSPSLAAAPSLRAARLIRYARMHRAIALFESIWRELRQLFAVWRRAMQPSKFYFTSAFNRKQ